MDKNYITFILAYDYGDVFERMELACDEAYDLAEEIANRFLKYMEGIYLNEYKGIYLSEYNCSEYEILQEYCDSISFEEIWSEVKGRG